MSENESDLVDRSRARLQVPEALLTLDELDVMYEAEMRTLWAFMRPAGRPSFTPSMLRDFQRLQGIVANDFGDGGVPLDHFVFGSRSPGVFCFGGDLDLFASLIARRDRAGLVAYGCLCVEILERNYRALDLPIITIGLAQGQALGGGFEGLLSFDFIIAEKTATFGLPEISFGLFPGMGAHVMLSRRLGAALADRIILSNRTYGAEELHELGLVNVLAEPGEGVAATKEFIAANRRRHRGVVNAMRASRIASPVTIDQLRGVVELWAEAALHVDEASLKLMRRLAAAQVRNHSSAA